MFINLTKTDCTFAVVNMSQVLYFEAAKTNTGWGTKLHFSNGYSLTVQEQEGEVRWLLENKPNKET